MPRARRRCATGWPLGFLALSAALLAGCTTKPYCEPLHRCGGDPMVGQVAGPDGQQESEWVATAADVCMDQVQLPVNPLSLAQQPGPTAGDKSASQATVDWCQSLSQKPDGSLRYQPFFPIIPYINAHLTFKEDGTYDAHFTSASQEHMDFSAACRKAQGIEFSCAELGRHVKEAIAAEANVYNMRCYDDGEGGCGCDYELLLFTSLPGTYGAKDGVMTFYDESLAPTPPSPADYCVKGYDTLELTGHNGQQLFNRPDLRTLVFHRPSCKDGLQDGDETGKDCGGTEEGCPACGTCNDGVLNGDEEGVDCGGSCPDFCPCFNGIQDPWEEGVDCGGTCSLLCSCTNGKKDANEDDIDCGGECQLRYSDKDAKPCN